MVGNTIQFTVYYFFCYRLKSEDFKDNNYFPIDRNIPLKNP